MAFYVKGHFHKFQVTQLISLKFLKDTAVRHKTALKTETYNYTLRHEVNGLQSDTVVYQSVKVVNVYCQLKQAVFL